MIIIVDKLAPMVKFKNYSMYRNSQHKLFCKNGTDVEHFQSSELNGAKNSKNNFMVEKSGLKVNSMKTELCLFYKNDTPPVTLKIGLDELSSKPTMNVLGIIFDTKMQWCPQVSQ